MPKGISSLDFLEGAESKESNDLMQLAVLRTPLVHLFVSRPPPARLIMVGNRRMRLS
jgi:hypothetical protein